MKAGTTLALWVLLVGTLLATEESLPPLKDGKPPQTFEELWAGYDPRKEPMEVEVLKEWEQEGIVMRVVRYRIGVFKGKRSMMAAVYGFPKGGTHLPGLVQIHGGGQFADANAPFANAKRGYATISIAWAGRISAPDYNVGRNEVRLFWDGKTTDPNYKLTTDWGALDGYHAPCRNPTNYFPGAKPAAWTLDSVESPRNSPWFLCALGARRALTFLEQQPEVDKNKLGVYGHSMGGKLTVMTAAADDRVKAAAPSCGGISDRNNDSALFRATVGDAAQLPHVACPIVFLSPANDFHGRIHDLQKAIAEIKSNQWRATCSPHHNHQDTEPYQIAGPLWFDQYLKGAFAFPTTPEGSLTLKTVSGVPGYSVQPDLTKKVLAVDVFYTQQGKEEAKDDMQNTIARFWHHAQATRRGDAWTADLPLLDTERPLWVYANVLYPLDRPAEGAGYYYGIYTATTFNLSSALRVASPADLKAAGVKATDTPSRLIESFDGDWRKEWFTYDSAGSWPRRTHKLYDPKWKAPPGAKLAFEVRSEQANKLIVGLDNAAAVVDLKGGTAWQSVVLDAADFHGASNASIADWKGIRELRLEPKTTLRSNVDGKEHILKLGADWQGAKPEFRNLRWVGGNAGGADRQIEARLADGSAAPDIETQVRKDGAWELATVMNGPNCARCQSLIGNALVFESPKRDPFNADGFV